MERWLCSCLSGRWISVTFAYLELSMFRIQGIIMEIFVILVSFGTTDLHRTIGIERAENFCTQKRSVLFCMSSKQKNFVLCAVADERSCFLRFSLSRPLKGSSKIKRSKGTSRARSKDNRRFMPPENSHTGWDRAFCGKELQRRQKVLRRKGAACTQNGDLSGHRSPPAADPPEKQRKF